MPKLAKIFSYLVPVGKGVDVPPDISSSAVPVSDKLGQMLAGVFDRSERECNIAISFKPDDAAAQVNVVHAQLVAFVKQPTLARGRRLAERLRDSSPTKSGLGLLFLLHGTEGNDQKLVVSRFPAEAGILAEVRKRGALDIKFIERIFLKRAHAYKAALYSGTAPQQHFWDGRAVDKQSSEQKWEQAASYWIHSFLASDFKTTPEAGTRRLAGALRKAIELAPTPEVKQEIISAATLAPGYDGHDLSISEFVDAKMHLSPDAQTCVLQQVQNDVVATEHFVLNRDEFKRQLNIRSLDLDTGVSVTGPAEGFDSLVTREPVADESGRIEIRTRGNVVSDRMKKGKQ